MNVAENVKVIPAIKKEAGIQNAGQGKKLKVAAYCRVSTESEEQASSYEAQIEHYTYYIKNNPAWEFAGIFADEGITGTNTKKREEFKRMIKACKEGKIDMIITKSISRFARNTLDCLKYIRELKEKNIPVYFEKENINTMDSKGEVLLTIMASLAQQESQSLSQNVRLGIQYRYRQGQIQINHIRFLGYTKDENKHLVIVPEEAEVVKRIFREYLEGSSLVEIARGLEADGILTAAGKTKWRPETLRNMLRNEKYMGDALLQKTYTVDFLTKKRIKNNGIVPQYYVENSHEAIIPREIFMQVQQEMIRRSAMKSGKKGKKRVYSSKYALSGNVICGKCGEIYRRVHWNNRGCRSIVWRCASRLEERGSSCTSRTVKEEVLHQAIVSAANEVLSDKDNYIETLRSNIYKVLNEGCESKDWIHERLEELQKELIRLAKEKEGYSKVVLEIQLLREFRKNYLSDKAGIEAKKERLVYVDEFLKEQSTKIEEYDDYLVRRFIDRVTVFDDRICIELKNGVEVCIR